MNRVGPATERGCLHPVPPPRPPAPPAAVAAAFEPGDDDYRRFFFLLLFGDVISTLPADSRHILDLMVWGRMTTTEVAAQTGLPRMTVFDKYTQTLTKIRRAAKNDPTVRLVFDLLRDLY